MSRQPRHQQRWHAPCRGTSHISGQDARHRETAAGHHTEVRDLLRQVRLDANPGGVLPQHHERSHATPLDGQPMDGGADAPCQSAMANDAAAPTHRRRNPGERFHGGATLQERVIPPVAEGHDATVTSSVSAPRFTGFSITSGDRTGTPVGLMSSQWPDLSVRQGDGAVRPRRTTNARRKQPGRCRSCSYSRGGL